MEFTFASVLARPPLDLDPTLCRLLLLLALLLSSPLLKLKKKGEGDVRTMK